MNIGIIKSFALFTVVFFAIVSCRNLESDKNESKSSVSSVQTVVGRKTYEEFVHQTIARINSERSLSEGVLLQLDTITSDTVYLKVKKSCGPDAHPWNYGIQAEQYVKMLINRLALAGNKNFVSLSFQELNYALPGVFPIASDEEMWYKSERNRIEFNETHVKLELWETNTITAKIDTIDSLTFANALISAEQRFRYADNVNIDIDSAEKAFHIIDSLNKIKIDSVILAVNKNRPGSIVITDSIFSIRCTDTTLKLMQDTSDAAGHGFQCLRFDHYRYGFLYLHVSGYEWHNYYVINPASKRYAVFQDLPKFISDTIAFTSANYYGDFFFELKGLNRSNVQFYMEVGDWKIQDCFNVKSVFYFCLSRDEIKLVYPIYLRLDFSEYF